MRCFKRIISLMLLVCILLGTGALPASASTGTLSEPTTEAPETGTTAVTAQTTAATESVPESTAPPQTEPPAETTAPTEAPQETEPTEIPEETLADQEAMTSQSSSMSFGTAGYSQAMERVPLYLQTDYPKVKYSDGTVATSGCTMTCIAMVGSYLTGKEYLPDAIARRFNNYEASNLQRMEAAATVLDLTYTKTSKWSEVEQALSEGKVVIAMLEKPSKFTKSQHTVVLTGITADGKIMVNDPYGPNYKKYELIDGFNNGFDPEMITYGFTLAWIFEEYTPPAPRVSRYPDMNLTEDEKYLIASVIWLEARGESFEGQQAIAEIIFNRMASGEFATTIEGTIKAEGQFRTAKFLEDAKPGELQYKAIEKALSGPYVLPMDVFFFGRKPTNSNVWGEIGRHIFCYAP